MAATSAVEDDIGAALASCVVGWIDSVAGGSPLELYLLLVCGVGHIDTGSRHKGRRGRRVCQRVWYISGSGMIWSAVYLLPDPLQEQGGVLVL